ncbi:Mu transposase C-terminal domain-containing protein [Burkholderia ubonensis]|uniref:Mu transposase C-terminal domain-containing protein n=1 Tax=Burkholderia ubonensis TaxID=101571 RepID=UPI001E496E63|nr:Mu transposase C-terminal domain-containing protein [Burkholderia ubonensis]
MLACNPDSRQLPPSTDAELRFLIRFLPVAQREIQSDGLTLFHVRYWHPIFVAWRETRRAVTVRYHPEDLSRVFVTSGSGDYVEVRYADMRRPTISLFEHRAALQAIRSEGLPTMARTGFESLRNTAILACHRSGTSPLLEVGSRCACASTPRRMNASLNSDSFVESSS